MLRGRSFGYLILVAGGLWLGEDSDREGGAGGWCGCGCVAERRRVGVEDGTGLAQWEKDLFSFLLRAACRASVGAPLLLCGHARTRVSGAVTSVLLERPPCGRRCVRARGWLLMSSKAMGGRKAVSHQVKLGWHVKIRRRGIYFLHGGCHGASSSGAARRRWAAVPR